MGTSTRPELSERNVYHIPKHRYYELKHFCLQYSDWKEHLRSLDGAKIQNGISRVGSGVNEFDSDVENCAFLRLKYQNYIDTVETSAREADLFLSRWILKGVTEDLSYENLRLVHGMPCCRNTYYNCYRKFFWALDRLRE